MLEVEDINDNRVRCAGGFNAPAIPALVSDSPSSSMPQSKPKTGTRNVTVSARVAPMSAMSRK